MPVHPARAFAVTLLAAALECPWDASRPFRGWQSPGAGPTASSCARYLLRIVQP